MFHPGFPRWKVFWLRRYTTLAAVPGVLQRLELPEFIEPDCLCHSCASAIIEFAPDMRHHALNVRYWHKTDNPTAFACVRYWSNGGQIRRS